MCRQDIVEPLLAKRQIVPVAQSAEGTGGADAAAAAGTTRTIARSLVRETGDEVRDSRIYLIGLGIVTLALALIMPSVVEALTVAYNLLVAGLFVPILGGLVFRRGTIVGVMAGMILGSVTTVVIMITVDIYANEAIYFGLLASLLGYLVGSLVSKPTSPEIMAAWRERLSR